MRYLICLLLLASTAHAGEVWVVASVKTAVKPSVWVVQKPSNDLKVPAKTCLCSNQCVCGCNDGKECNCNKTPPETQTGRQFVSAAICTTGTCSVGR